ncbi:hypothetical protein Bbelb_051960 [Branchiostoma belcheri]|nr:hypothetical protein Bbelb_051960 [Branchiostoma belcheri]
MRSDFVVRSLRIMQYYTEDSNETQDGEAGYPSSSPATTRCATTGTTAAGSATRSSAAVSAAAGTTTAVLGCVRGTFGGLFHELVAVDTEGNSVPTASYLQEMEDIVAKFEEIIPNEERLGKLEFICQMYLNRT